MATAAELPTGDATLSRRLGRHVNRTLAVGLGLVAVVIVFALVVGRFASNRIRGDFD